MTKVEEHVVTPEDLSNDQQVEIVKVVLDDKGSIMYIGSLSADDFVEWTEAKESGEPEARKNASARLMMLSLVKGPDKSIDGKELTPDQRTAASIRIGTPAHTVAFRKAKVSRTEKLLKAILKLNYINQKDEVDTKKS